MSTLMIELHPQGFVISTVPRRWRRVVQEALELARVRRAATPPPASPPSSRAPLAVTEAPALAGGAA